MKKIHVVMLVAIAAVVAVLVSMMGDLSTYETIASAKQKQGKAVTVIARLDRDQALGHGKGATVRKDHRTRGVEGVAKFHCGFDRNRWGYVGRILRRCIVLRFGHDCSGHEKARTRRAELDGFTNVCGGCCCR